MNQYETEKQKLFEVLKTGGHTLSFDRRFLDDKEIVIALIRHNNFPLHKASHRLKNDMDVVLAAIEKSPFAFESSSKELHNNKEVVLTAVMSNGYNLKFASARLKNDKEVVLEAAKVSTVAILHASPELQELCREKDPVKTLEAAIFAEKLTNQLASKQQQAKPKLKI